ncbi:MAG: hypothetical protein KKE52_11800 [Alphaproteobacteria bacterium]|nr:hypothetical protein [Alphaproteobacteria bacterium]MBU2271970.1 hypothetical protein [Alphaproteobacteria bacterium]
MRKLAFLAPLGAVLAIAAASPAAADPATVTVTVGPDLRHKVRDLGERDVREQTDRLARIVREGLADTPRLDGARIELVLTDLRPNRPTFQQMASRPGLDPFLSLSIGGAAVEGVITTADGEVLPVKYDWFSHNLADVVGYSTWHDADRAYRRLADHLADGRYVSR